MRFVDATVFIYAIAETEGRPAGYRPAKKAAAKISSLRVNAGEPVTTTTVHLSEVANVLEDAAEWRLQRISRPYPETRHHCRIGLPMTTGEHTPRPNHAIGINDALPWSSWSERISEIYTFDRHFRETRVKVVQE